MMRGFRLVEPRIASGIVDHGGIAWIVDHDWFLWIRHSADARTDACSGGALVSSCGDKSLEVIYSSSLASHVSREDDRPSYHLSRLSLSFKYPPVIRHSVRPPGQSLAAHHVH